MSEYEPLLHGAPWATLVVTLIIGVLTILVPLIIRRYPDAREVGARRRHRDTMLLAGLAALQRGDNMDLLFWAEFRELAEEMEKEMRAKGRTGKSFAEAFPAFVGRGEPPAVEKEDEEELEVGAVHGSVPHSPASHCGRGRSSRPRSKSPVKPATMPRHDASSPSLPLDSWSGESIVAQCRVQRALDDNSFPHH